MVEWVRPKVAEWTEAVKNLQWYTTRYLQAAYSVLAMSLQSEWYYLQRKVLRVRYIMGTVEDTHVGSFVLALLGTKEVGRGLRKLLALSTKCAGLGVPHPMATGRRLT